jgi:hypothetical protein
MDIEKEINLIKERNVKVEVDKAWETSIFRIFLISFVTYVIASFVMYFIGVSNFLLNALIPTIGYLLSAQSLPIVKRWWVNKYFKK